MSEIGDEGYIRIANENDRMTVVSILYKNGYTVRPVRTLKNGKTYVYMIRYEQMAKDIAADGNEIPDR